MENMTLPGGVASLWAGAGARYSWRGVCGCATRTIGGIRQREIYNFVGPDGRGVVMKWNTSNGDDSIGGYAEARNPTAAVTYIFSPKYAMTGSATYDFGINQSLSNSLVVTRIGSDLTVSFGFTYNALLNNFGFTLELVPNIVAVGRMRFTPSPFGSTLFR